jgi:hypothetical protein
MNMNSLLPASPMILQQLRKALAAVLLLTLCAVLQGCATSGPNLASYNNSDPQALMTWQSKGREAQPQTPSFVQLLSVNF